MDIEDIEKPKRPVRGSKKRSERLGPFRVTKLEYDLFNTVCNELIGRGMVDFNIDAFIFMIEAAYEKLDMKRFKKIKK